MTMWMEWMTQHLSHGACAHDVTVCNRRDYARYSHVGVSGSGRWCSHRAVPRNHGCCHWRPRHAVSRNHWCCHWRSRCALSPSHGQFWIFHFSEFSTSCPNSHLVIKLYQFIITFSCSHFVHTFCTAETSFEVWYLHTPSVIVDRRQL